MIIITDNSNRNLITVITLAILLKVYNLNTSSKYINYLENGLFKAPSDRRVHHGSFTQGQIYTLGGPKPSPLWSPRYRSKDCS